MKKLLTVYLLIGFVVLGAKNHVFAQEEEASSDSSETVVTDLAEDENPVESSTEEIVSSIDEGEIDEEVVAKRTFHQVIKEKFIEGGAGFMSLPLICLIIGLAIAIERIITLNLVTTNTTKLLENVETGLNSGGLESAKEVARSTRGPVADIFYQGLSRFGEGLEMVEKSVVSYGSVQVGRLEKGLIWVSLFIALAPMLGFMGTVIGMIAAFDAIEAAGDISPSLVAGGIKVALLTTVAGLIVAIILQVFYNYCVSKIDSLVNEMENASVSLIDVLVKYNETK